MHFWSVLAIGMPTSLPSLSAPLNLRTQTRPALKRGEDLNRLGRETRDREEGGGIWRGTRNREGGRERKGEIGKRI